MEPEMKQAQHDNLPTIVHDIETTTHQGFRKTPRLHIKKWGRVFDIMIYIYVYIYIHTNLPTCLFNFKDSKPLAVFFQIRMATILGNCFLSRKVVRFSTCGWNGPDASFEKNGHKISYLALALKVGDWRSIRLIRIHFWDRFFSNPLTCQHCQSMQKLSICKFIAFWNMVDEWL